MNNNPILINALRFLGLLMLQVLVLNEIELHGFVNPYIYPLFILLLPFETPHWLQLLLAFAIGLLIDIYANTIGFHAAASVAMAYIRPFLMQMFRPSGGYDNKEHPVMVVMGLNWTLFYITSAILLHHIILFSIEAGSFSNITGTLSKIGLGAIVSVFVMMLYQFILVPKQ